MDSTRASVEKAVREWSDAAWKTLQSVYRKFPSLSSPFSRRRKRCCASLPLPLPPSWPLSLTVDESGTAIILVTELLEEVASTVICRVHDTHKNLQFWKARAEQSNMQKVSFMVLERGALAFAQGIAKLARERLHESPPTQSLAVLAVSHIVRHTVLLQAIEHRLAVVLAEVYKEAERFGKRVGSGQVDALSLTLCSLHAALVTMEGQYTLNPSGYMSRLEKEEVELMLQFNDLPEELAAKTTWTDAEVISCSELIRGNMKRLEDCLDRLMQNCRKPRRATRYWLRYTGGAVGLALVSGWLIQHSPLMGSHDIENWLKQGGKAMIAFTKEHVEEPLKSIRDDLFETFRRRHRGAAELTDVQLTVDSLHRMLKAFTEQLKGRDVADGATVEEMMEIVMNRYEKEITHPLQNLLGGELFRAMLIQVQKLKLDIETAMLELNQILRANEINFAILAAMPAFLFAMIFGWLLRASLLKSKGSEGRGRASRLQRRLLLAKVERTILEIQTLMEQGQEDEILPHYGMTIYLLDRFYKAVERHATATGEWSSLRGDIIDLASSKASIIHKLAITARIERIYECIIPPRLK